MANLPASPFVFGEFTPFSPDEAAVSHPQTSGDTAADILESSAAVAQDAVNVLVAGSNPASPATDCIGEIFVGAARLQLSGLDLNGHPWVDSAYSSSDEATYHLLKQMDDPHAADLIDIPEFMWREFDPSPLFLQASGF